MNGKERRWGPLSRTNTWRVGCFLKDLNGAARVFIEKDGERKEVQAEERIEGGKARIWLTEKTSTLPQVLEVGDHEPPQGNQDDGMQEDTPEERQSQQQDALTERVTSLKKENWELKNVVQEMQDKAAGQTEAIRATADRFSMM